MMRGLGKAAKLGAILASLLALSACASWFPWSAERLATTQRVAERCTSISNVIGKNYQVSGRLNLVAGGAGGSWGQTGVQLSAEAAERQIQMDRLCRAWAVGAITDEKWSDLYIQFALASIAPLARSDTPEAKEQIALAQAALAEATTELQKARSESAYSPTNDAKKLADGVEVAAKSTESLSEISKRLDRAIASTGLVSGAGQQGGVSAGDAAAIRGDMAEQQRVLIETLGVLQGRLDEIKVKQSGNRARNEAPPGKSWQPKSTISAFFSIGSFELSSQTRQVLNQEFTHDYPHDVRLEVIGYADTSGNPQRNALLSLARAQEVRDYLVVDRGIPADAIVPIGRQQSSTAFGSPAENRVVKVRVFELRDLPPGSNGQSSR